MGILAIGIALVLNLHQRPAFECVDMEKKEIVRKFFKEQGLGEPEIDRAIKGKATVRVEWTHLELMLTSVLTPLAATYRYEAGKFRIIPLRKK